MKPGFIMASLAKMGAGCHENHLKNGGGTIVRVPGTKTLVPPNVPDWQNGKKCVFLYPLLQAMSDVSAVISAFSKNHHKVSLVQKFQKHSKFYIFLEQLK